MSKDQQRTQLSAAKEQLVREGELYRVSVLHARAQVANALRPDALVHGAIEHALGVVQHRLASLFGGLGGATGEGGAGLGGLAGLVKGMGLTRALPIALKVGGFIARRRLVKPALLVGALAVAGGLWLSRRKP
ncbi:hypothetical protein LJR289_003026 [Pseudoduganella sp. LjRoot289]|uniref:hypothetical protein n=1 Tax=Pseudoduganella sp. LjRoot289 TaxID=3342314 RepID=UPI003ECEEBCA